MTGCINTETIHTHLDELTIALHEIICHRVVLCIQVYAVTDNLTFTVDGEPRTVNSVTISSRQVGNDTLYSETLKKHYLNPIYATNVIIKGFPGKKDRLTIPAISSVAKLRGCINIYPEYYDCFGKFTGSPLDRHEFQGLELQLISR